MSEEDVLEQFRVIKRLYEKAISLLPKGLELLLEFLKLSTRVNS